MISYWDPHSDGRLAGLGVWIDVERLKGEREVSPLEEQVEAPLEERVEAPLFGLEFLGCSGSIG